MEYLQIENDIYNNQDVHNAKRLETGGMYNFWDLSRGNSEKL